MLREPRTGAVLRNRGACIRPVTREGSVGTGSAAGLSDAGGDELA